MSRPESRPAPIARDVALRWLRAGADVTPSAPRVCGPCSACCTALGVKDLAKPAGSPCGNATGTCEARCSIYPTRPESCSTWSCAWRLGCGGLDDRPDVAGVIVEFTVLDDPTLVAATGILRLWPDRRHRLNTGRWRRRIETALDAGVLVFVFRADASRAVYLPPRLDPQAVAQVRVDAASHGTATVGAYLGGEP